MRRSALEAFLARDRIPVLAALAAAAALAWAYLVLAAGGMHSGMSDMSSMADAMRPRPWTAAHYAMMLGMWAAMMVGMMLPPARHRAEPRPFRRRDRSTGQGPAPWHCGGA
jgi:predicted metal-binding membrane protein